MDGDAVRRVESIVRDIPPGEVMSYGEIAQLAGLSSARLVGRILGQSEGLPWHRVVRADGTLTPHLAGRQTELLLRDGVRVVNGRVHR
jgi:alkylated DNA nucleotide flippase Atl1